MALGDGLRHPGGADDCQDLWPAIDEANEEIRGG